MPCSFASSFASSFTPCIAALETTPVTRHRMPDVRRQVDTVTLDFPGAAFAGDEVVFIRVIAFLQDSQ